MTQPQPDRKIPTPETAPELTCARDLFSDMSDDYHAKMADVIASYFSPLRADLALANERLAEEEKALRKIAESAQAIQLIISDERWSCPKDPLWVPTINDYAHCIKEDAETFLYTRPANEQKTEGVLTTIPEWQHQATENERLKTQIAELKWELAHIRGLADYGNPRPYNVVVPKRSDGKGQP